jgi:outer membrane immunogenic protein
VVAGFGGEYAFAPDWSVRLEYNFIRMFQQQPTLTGSFFLNGAFFQKDFVVPKRSLRIDLHLIKA